MSAPDINRVRDMYSWATGWRPDVLPDQPHMANVQATLRAEFDAALAAHDAVKRAEWEAEQGETEWEYGIEYGPSNEEFEGYSREHHERQVNGIRKNGGLYAPTARVMRRRRAGDAEPVPGTTNNESEDEK